MSDAFIIDACRTPRGIGKFPKGALSQIHPQRLGSTVLKALAERNDLNTADVDDVIWGTSSQRGPQTIEGKVDMLYSDIDAKVADTPPGPANACDAAKVKAAGKKAAARKRTA